MSYIVSTYRQQYRLHFLFKVILDCPGILLVHQGKLHFGRIGVVLGINLAETIAGQSVFSMNQRIESRNLFIKLLSHYGNHILNTAE